MKQRIQHRFMDLLPRTEASRIGRAGLSKVCCASLAHYLTPRGVPTATLRTRCNPKGLRRLQRSVAAGRQRRVVRAGGHPSCSRGVARAPVKRRRPMCRSEPGRSVTATRATGQSGRARCRAGPPITPSGQGTRRRRRGGRVAADTDRAGRQHEKSGRDLRRTHSSASTERHALVGTWLCCCWLGGARSPSRGRLLLGGGAHDGRGLDDSWCRHQRRQRPLHRGLRRESNYGRGLGVCRCRLRWRERPPWGR